MKETTFFLLEGLEGGVYFECKRKMKEKKKKKKKILLNEREETEQRFII